MNLASAIYMSGVYMKHIEAGKDVATTGR